MRPACWCAPWMTPAPAGARCLLMGPCRAGAAGSAHTQAMYTLLVSGLDGGGGQAPGYLLVIIIHATAFISFID